MTATAYIRVSSRAQDHATQRAAIERFAATRDDTIDDWRAEKKTRSRPVAIAARRAWAKLISPRSSPCAPSRRT